MTMAQKAKLAGLQRLLNLPHNTKLNRLGGDLLTFVVFNVCGLRNDIDFLYNFLAKFDIDVCVLIETKRRKEAVFVPPAHLKGYTHHFEPAIPLPQYQNQSSLSDSGPQVSRSGGISILIKKVVCSAGIKVTVDEPGYAVTVEVLLPSYTTNLLLHAIYFRPYAASNALVQSYLARQTSRDPNTVEIWIGDVNTHFYGVNDLSHTTPSRLERRSNDAHTRGGYRLPRTAMFENFLLDKHLYSGRTTTTDRLYFNTLRDSETALDHIMGNKVSAGHHRITLPASRTAESLLSGESVPFPFKSDHIPVFSVFEMIPRPAVSLQRSWKRRATDIAGYGRPRKPKLPKSEDERRELWKRYRSITETVYKSPYVGRPALDTDKAHRLIQQQIMSAFDMTGCKWASAKGKSQQCRRLWNEDDTADSMIKGSKIKRRFKTMHTAPPEHIGDLWEAFNRSKERASKPAHYVRMKDGSYTADPEEVEKEWRDHFRNTSHTSLSIPPDTRRRQLARADRLARLIAHLEENPENHPYLDSNFSMTELEGFLESTGHGKAAGPDSIIYEFVRYGSCALKRDVLRLIETVRAGAKCPLVWHHACLCPLHKKGETSLPICFRPVSLRCVFSKIFEGIMYFRYTHVLRWGKIGPYPPGFKHFGIRQGVPSPLRCSNNIAYCPFESCLDHISNQLHIISSAANDSARPRPTYLMGWDMAKFFDKVPHSVIWGRVFERFKFRGVSTMAMYKILRVMRNHIKLAENWYVPGYSQVNGCPQGSVASCFLAPSAFEPLFELIDKYFPAGNKDGEAPQVCPGVVYNLAGFCDDLAALTHTLWGLLLKVEIIVNWCNDQGIELNLGKFFLLVFNAHLAPADFSSSSFLQILHAKTGAKAVMRSEMEVSNNPVAADDSYQVLFSSSAKSLGYIMSVANNEVAHINDRRMKARVAFNNLTRAGVGYKASKSWPLRSVAVSSLPLATLFYGAHLSALDPVTKEFCLLKGSWLSFTTESFGISTRVSRVNIPLLSWTVNVISPSDIVFRNAAGELGRILRGFPHTLIFKTTEWLLRNGKPSWQNTIWTSAPIRDAVAHMKGSVRASSKSQWKAAVSSALRRRKFMTMRRLTEGGAVPTCSQQLSRFFCPDREADLAHPPVFTEIGLNPSELTLLLALRLGSWRHKFEGTCNGLGHKCALCQTAPGQAGAPTVTTAHLFLCPRKLVTDYVAPVLLECALLFSELNVAHYGPKLNFIDLPTTQWLAFCLGAFPSIVRWPHQPCQADRSRAIVIDPDKFKKEGLTWMRRWRKLIRATLGVARSLLKLQKANCCQL